MATRWKPRMTYRDHLKAKMFRKAESVASRFALNELEYLVASLRQILASKKSGAPVRLVEFDVERGRPELIGCGRGMKANGRI